jgi:hypothetical protein
VSANTSKALAGALLFATALAASGCSGSGEPIATVDWSRTRPLSGTAAGGTVRVSAPATGGAFPLAVIRDPAVPAEGYAVVGRVRYQGVEAAGYLEMWSGFADGSRYFSRTLGRDGPQGSLTGTSGWRAFELPFFLDGAPPPTELEIGVVLPGAGVVEVGRLELVALGASGGWWTERAGGLVGGIGGSLIGIFGALIGWLVARRRARTFTLGAMRAAVALGVVLLGAGLVALATSQPYAVAYPILLSGVIMVAVFGGLLPGARRAYADHELRRMRALDQV